jgi:hypothetical protein
MGGVELDEEPFPQLGDVYVVEIIAMEKEVGPDVAVLAVGAANESVAALGQHALDEALRGR